VIELRSIKPDSSGRSAGGGEGTSIYNAFRDGQDAIPFIGSLLPGAHLISNVRGLLEGEDALSYREMLAMIRGTTGVVTVLRPAAPENNSASGPLARCFAAERRHRSRLAA
jgi:hypothetical protein